MHSPSALLLRLLPCLLVASAVGCTSDDATQAADAAVLDGNSPANPKTPDANTLPRDAGSEAHAPADGGAPPDSEPLDGAVADAARHDAAVDSSAPAAVDASMACVTFCTCMAHNCADRVFPGGCLHDCATNTKWDLPCRQNMCGLVVPQPNNDHCTHAFGLVQCLDLP